MKQQENYLSSIDKYSLQNYCALNEPYPPEMENSFRFFQGVALSGQNNPNSAWDIFQMVANGIQAEDNILNEILKSIYPSPSVDLISKDGKVNQKNGKRKHTLIEYYNKVMVKSLITENLFQIFY